jgi:hypothetical protein
MRKYDLINRKIALISHQLSYDLLYSNQLNSIFMKPLFLSQW